MAAALFVYGTLKRGGANHGFYCHGARSITPATVWGRLYHLSFDYPMLVVPPETALVWGTSDRAADVAAAEQLAIAPAPALPLAPTGDWNQITGELIVFDDLPDRFADLDDLEGYAPGGHGYYDRAIVWAFAPEPRLAWVYVAPHGQVDPDARLIGTTWPGDESPQRRL